MRTDLKRLEEFQALRAGIRGSNQHLIVGIDVAKERHHAFFGTPTGRTLRKRLVVENQRSAFEKLLALCRDLQTQYDLPECVFGLEPTGVYHKPLLEFLIRSGETVVLVSNVAAQRNRESLNGRWDKNDEHDAANVADLVSQGKCLFAEQPWPELRELRSLVRARARLKKREHALRMRIRNHLVAQYFPELEGGYGQGAGNTDTLVLQVIRQGFGPDAVASMPFEAFWERLVQPRWGEKQRVRARRVWEAAATSIGCELDEVVRWEAQRLVRQLDALRDDLREIEAGMREAVRAAPGYRSVISVPGVGPILAAMILAAIGDPHRFSHSRQILRLAGLDLCASRSGKGSDRAVPKISKQGKGGLRYALVHAAMVGAIHHGPVRQYYSRLLHGRAQERGIRRKMQVKLAAKLLVVAWTLMKRNETFDGAQFGGGAP